MSRREEAMRRLARTAAKGLVRWPGLQWLDRRQHFYDVAAGRKTLRGPTSRVLQFYSSAHNIGNYTPILGTRQMLGFQPDVWDIHSEVDFDYVNRTYDAVIVGGAGLFHRAFEPFWRTFVAGCRLPSAIWGVGVCIAEKGDNTAVSPQLVKRVEAVCDLINVRDNLTANYYDLSNVSITPCPTVVWLHQREVGVHRRNVLYSSHTELVPPGDRLDIANTLSRLIGHYSFTDNIQRIRFGLTDIVEEHYLRSRVVVTTRLHGAIFAYSLGIPYVAVPWDRKLRAFHEDWGNGLVVEDAQHITESMLLESSQYVSRPIEVDSILEFGERTVDWLEHHGALRETQ